MISNFEKTLNNIRIILLVSGIKTYELKYNKYIVKFIENFVCYINCITLHSVVLGEIVWIINGVNDGKSFIELSINLPLINISLLGTIKTFPLFFKRDIVKLIIDTLINIHPEDIDEYQSDIDINGDDIGNFDDINLKEEAETKKMKAKENDIVNESLNVLYIVKTILFTISAIVLATFCFTPPIFMIHNYFHEGHFIVMYPYAVIYGFDIFNTIFWPILYAHQIIATAIVCFNLFAAELLFYLLCSFLEMHFRILCLQFENMKYGPSRNVKKVLVKAIRRHQQLIYIADLGEQLYAKSGLFNIVSSSVIICLSAFNITMADDIQIVFAFTAFLTMNFLQISLMCFFGDKLMESSSQVTNAVYTCPWYYFDMDTKKDILFILMRSSRPCKLTAAKFADLNLRAFTTILSHSWSYFALLKTVYK